MDGEPEAVIRKAEVKAAPDRARKLAEVDQTSRSRCSPGVEPAADPRHAFENRVAIVKIADHWDTSIEPI